MLELIKEFRKFNLIHCVIITAIGVALGVFGLAFQSGWMYLIYLAFMFYILSLVNHRYFYLEIILILLMMFNFTWTYLYVGKIITLAVPVAWSYLSMFVSIVISVTYLGGNILYRIRYQEPKRENPESKTH